NGLEVRSPGPDLTAIRDGLRAIRIVQAEDGRLREDISRAKTGRMFWIALDFGRTPQMALDEHWPRHAAKRNRTREEERFAGDHVLRLPDVTDDAFGGLP